LAQDGPVGGDEGELLGDEVACRGSEQDEGQQAHIGAHRCEPSGEPVLAHGRLLHGSAVDTIIPSLGLVPTTNDADASGVSGGRVRRVLRTFPWRKIGRGAALSGEWT